VSAPPPAAPPADAARAPGASGDSPDSADWRPAGFWRRYLAYCLDWTLLALPLYALLAPPLARAWAAWQAINSALQGWLLDHLLAAPGELPAPLALARALLADASMQATLAAAADRLNTALLQAIALGVVAAAVYFIGFESSPWAATPGKRALGLRVCDLSGQRLAWPRSSLRFAAGGLSWLSLNLGHALAGWRRDGRALHDLVAGTQVLARTPTPAWARALLLGQLLLLLAVFALLFGRVLWLLAQLGGAAG
jgi:uncharacterized RDD family membrane protein YckC